METFILVLLLICSFALYLRELRKRYGAELELNLLKEKFSLRGLRAREFAHELKHPISAIVTTLDSLVTDSESDFNSDISIITNEAKDLYEFINNFLLICMAETGHLNGKPSSQNLSEALNQITKLLEVKANLKNISINVSSAFDDLYVFVDRTHLKQIFFNLLNNAIDHNPEGTRVYIESSTNDLQDYLEIIVRDNGRGISSNDQIRLRNIFKGDGLKKDSATTGLGLSLSSELTRFAGGELILDESYENGTCFRVSLPIATVKTYDSRTENKKVLLLSEGNSCSANIAKQIESLGCTVESISEVISALEALGSNDYDAVIVDHKIDNDSGFELAKLIDEELDLDETKKFVALSDEDFSPEIFSLSDKESWPIKREILKELIG